MIYAFLVSFFDLINDLIDQFYSEDLVCEDRSLVDSLIGHAEVVEALDRQREAFPDLRYELERAVFEGDSGAICWTARGKYEKNLGKSNLPNQKEFSVQGMSFFEF